MNAFLMQSMLHPVYALEHLLVLLALGLLCGQQGWQSIRWTVPSFALALALGLVLTRFIPTPLQASLILLVITALLGLLLTLKLSLAPAWVVVFTVPAGLLMGWDSALSFLPGMRLQTIYTGLIVIGLTATLLLSVFAVCSLALNKLWSGLVVRVLGAWLAAAAIMVVALSVFGLA